MYTDSTDYAQTVLGRGADLWSVPAAEISDELRSLVKYAYGAKEISESTVRNGSRWHHLFLVETAKRSHFDLLIELGRAGVRLPDRVLCLAGAGEHFHGFKGRPWSAPQGNTYLAVHLRPDRVVSRPATSFTVLAALSVVDAIDTIPGLEKAASIKWVNDILIDGAKVAGVLAYTQSSGKTVSGAVLGIGVNVETQPDIEPTPFVPRACALQSQASRREDCTQQTFFAALASALDANYGLLLAGGYEALLERYRDRSSVIGHHVTLCSDEPGQEFDVLAEGRVTGIGDGLELAIEGYRRPFTKGRLVIGSVDDSVSRKR